MHVSKELLKVLYCPFTRDKLIYDREKEELVSVQAKMSFPVMDGIPILLKEAAKPIDQARLQALMEQEKADDATTMEESSELIGSAYIAKVKEKCL